MTRDYNVILPVIFTVGFAYVVRKRFSEANVYTLKNLRRGLMVPEGLEAALDSSRTARYMMTGAFVVAPADGGEDGPLPREAADAEVVVLERDGAVTGARLVSPAGDPTRPARYVFVDERRRMRAVLAAFFEADADVVLVTGAPGEEAAGDVIGVITTAQLGRMAREDSQLRP
jgi:CIC family chloride channel protein